MLPTSRRVALSLGFAAALAVGGYAELDGRRAAEEERRRAQRPALGRWRVAATPSPLPPLAFVDSAGATRGLAEWRGRVVLLNLWATWCAPCVEEMPALDRLQARLGGEGFEVIALAGDRQGEAIVRPFVAKLGLAHLALYLDPPGAASRALAVRGLPTTLLVDRAGAELARLEGAGDWDGPALEAPIRRALAASSRKG